MFDPTSSFHLQVIEKVTTSLFDRFNAAVPISNLSALIDKNEVISSLTCVFSRIKIFFSDYTESLNSRKNEVYVFF